MSNPRPCSMNKIKLIETVRVVYKKPSHLQTVTQFCIASLAN